MLVGSRHKFPLPSRAATGTDYPIKDIIYSPCSFADLAPHPVDAATARHAIALFSTLAHGLMIIMLLLLPETRGRVFASLEQEAPGAMAYPSRSAVGCS